MRLTGAALLPGLAFATMSTHAAGDLMLIDKPPDDGYTLSVGPSVTGYPQAPGSGRTKVTGLPGVDFYASSGVFLSTDVGAGINFSRREDLQFGLRLWPVFGRDDDRSRSRGLRDIGTRLGRGVFLNVAPWEFLILQSSVLAGSAYAGDGVQAEFGATVGAPLGGSTLLGLTLGTTWANAPYMRSYDGVSTAESAQGGLPAYAPRSSWKDVSLALAGETKLSDRWKLSGQWLEAALMGAAKSSPVTESRRETRFSLTLWYEIR